MATLSQAFVKSAAGVVLRRKSQTWRTEMQDGTPYLRLKSALETLADAIPLSSDGIMPVTESHLAQLEQVWDGELEEVTP